MQQRELSLNPLSVEELQKGDGEGGRAEAAGDEDILVCALMR